MKQKDNISKITTMITWSEEKLEDFFRVVLIVFIIVFPSWQEVNENSLKRLNGYLETLQKSGSRYIEPTKLTFYMRDTKDSSSTQTESLSSGGTLFVMLLMESYVLGRYYTLCPIGRFPERQLHLTHQRRPQHGDGGSGVLQPVCGAHAGAQRVGPNQRSP